MRSPILRALGTEVMVVDGGSRDATIQRARLRADRVIAAPRGRGLQMNAGADKASGDVLLFLHADTRLPADADHVVLNGLERSGRVWGRFDVEIEGQLAAAGRHRLADEPSLAAHRHCDRRPGDVRAARRIPGGRRLCGDSADGGHRRSANASSA